MKRLLVLSLLVCALSNAQQFPGAIATDADLLVAYNAAEKRLDAGINDSVTTFVVTDGSEFGNNMVVLIDTEAIFCTTLSTNTFSGCTRGFDGTIPAAHATGAWVVGVLAAKHHNSLADEVIAIETALGLSLANIQSADAELAEIAALNCSNGEIIKETAGSWACAADGGEGSELLSTTDTAVDIANVNDGACSATKEVALTGAALGDFVTIASTTDVLTDSVYIHARVSSANTVRYYVCNLSGAAHDPVPADYRIQIVRP